MIESTDTAHRNLDDMLRAQVVVPNRAGLHARSAATLLKTSAAFHSRVTLAVNGNRASARSLMELLRLSARQGDTVGIEVHGPDAEAALEVIRTLIENGFGEE